MNPITIKFYRIPTTTTVGFHFECNGKRINPASAMRESLRVGFEIKPDDTPFFLSLMEKIYAQHQQVCRNLNSLPPYANN